MSTINISNLKTLEVHESAKGGRVKLSDEMDMFNSALNAVTKTVTVEIAQADLQTLKTSDYKLCFAKKVGNNDFNVVWQSYSKYLMYNNFSWTPQYNLFGSNTFVSNVTVRVSTNKVAIGLGQTSTLDSSGILEQPVTGGPTTAFTMNNQYGSIHPGVEQLSTGLDGTTVSTPIYVSTNPIVMGPTELTPVEKILIWFEQNVETSTMFSTSRSNSIELDLTALNSKTVKYENQTWTII